MPARYTPRVFVKGSFLIVNPNPVNTAWTTQRSRSLVRLMITAVFRQSTAHRYTSKSLRDHIQSLMVSDSDMRALAHLKWLQSRTSQTLPDLFFETGAIALETGGTITLPYEKQYTLDAYRKAEPIRLVPALAAVVST